MREADRAARDYTKKACRPSRGPRMLPPVAVPLWSLSGAPAWSAGRTDCGSEKLSSRSPYFPFTFSSSLVRRSWMKGSVSLSLESLKESMDFSDPIFIAERRAA